MRILTEILSSAGLRKRKLLVQNSRIIVKREKKMRGRPEYSAEFTPRSLIHYTKGFGPFKILKQKLMLIDGADKCIEFYYGAVDQNNYVDELINEANNNKNIKEEDKKEQIEQFESARVLIPVWDRETENRHAEATVIKNAGTISNKIEVPPMLYVAIFMSIAISVLTMLVASGRLKI